MRCRRLFVFPAGNCEEQQEGQRFGKYFLVLGKFPRLFPYCFIFMSKREMAPSSSSSPCAACTFLRLKCTSECVFVPYFPPDQPNKFANVHKIFGASNITKLLNELSPHRREDAMISLAYEVEARMKDPIYGCMGAISILQRQLQNLQRELYAAHMDLAHYTGGAAVAVSNPIALLQQGMGMGGMQVSSPLGISMAGTSHSMHHQHQHQQQQQQVFDGQLTREQLVELTRVGGMNSYESGFVALGINSNNNNGGGSISIPSSPTGRARMFTLNSYASNTN